MLQRFTHGEPTEKPALLIAHGLFGSAQNWRVIAKKLATDRQVVTVDMRNHAGSFWAESHTYHDLAKDLADVIDAPMDVLGHSMGGKAAMVLALEFPHLINKLVIADIAPVGYSHSQSHLIDALEKVDLGQITSRNDADAQMTTLIPDRQTRAFLLQSLDVKEKKWLLNLPVLRAFMDPIIGFPELDGQFTGPSLFLSGAASDYVQHSHRPLIKSLFAEAKFAKIPGAGHWLHAERPAEFEAATRVFLDMPST